MAIFVFVCFNVKNVSKVHYSLFKSTCITAAYLISSRTLTYQTFDFNDIVKIDFDLVVLVKAF